MFNDNAAGVAALKNKQIDGFVVDLPTGFYLANVEVEGGVLVGQLPDPGENPEEFGLLLEKGSPITGCVPTAVDALRSDGTLEELQQEWLNQGGAHRRWNDRRLSSPVPSPLELRRRAVRRAQARRRTAVAALSSVVVLGSLAAAIVLAPGWPVVQATFFNVRYGVEVVPPILEGLRLNVLLTAVCSVVIAVLGLLLALARTSRAPRWLRSACWRRCMSTCSGVSRCCSSSC